MWWIIVHTPDGAILTWPAGEQPGDDEVNAARTLVGFPVADTWLEDGSGWDIQLTHGEPHHTLLAKATVGTLADLQAVDSTEHAAARAQWYAERHLQQVTEALAALHHTDVAKVLAHPDVAKKVAAAKGGKP